MKDLPAGGLCVSLLYLDVSLPWELASVFSLTAHGCDTAIYLPHLLYAACDGLSDSTAGQREKPGKLHGITRASSSRMERIVDPLTDSLFFILAPQVILSQSQDKALRRIGELREVGPTVSFVTQHPLKEEPLSKMYYKYRRGKGCKSDMEILAVESNFCLVMCSISAAKIHLHWQVH